MEESRVKDYFGTFLDSANRGTGPGDSPTVAPDRQISPIEALAVLAREGEMPIDQYQTTLGVNFLSLGTLLPRLVDLDLVEISGAPGQEQIRLTDEGQKYAKLAELA
jgi:hypothetical protein